VLETAVYCGNNPGEWISFDTDTLKRKKNTNLKDLQQINLDVKSDTTTKYHNQEVSTKKSIE
jgi:hypothetical protein